MKTLFKRLGLTLLLLICAATALGAHEWYAEKPFFLRAFFDRTLLKVSFDSPETLTSIGFLESVGIKGHNAKLDDASPEKTDELFRTMKHARETLMSYQDESLSEDQRLSKEIAMYLLDLAVEMEPYRFHDYPVNQLFGVQSDLPSFMDSQHQITDLEDAQNYVARLNQFQRQFKQHLAGLKLREQQGILPPKFVVQRVLEEMQNFVATPVQDNILYSSLARRLEEVEAEEQAKAALLQQAETAINQEVYPAYRLFIDYFIPLEDKAGTDDGVWHLPQGDVVYQQALRFFTTTDYTAEHIHNTGLAEVARIQGEILTILAEQGYDTSAGFTAAIEQLKHQEQFYYPDTDEGREQILEDYRKILEEIDAGIDSAFNIRPKSGMEVKRIPEFKEKTSPGAYYQQPSIDGTRPGTFFANLYDIKATPKYSMRTLAYHEGIPGHHFQVAISQELEGLPLFRTISPFTAYVEGWALYTEYLAWEMGFQNDPFDNIGRLQAELFRGVRLVVDTGIHQMRWTREQAIDYMLKNTGMAESDVVSEIERYIVLPGQATAYKVGMMKILEVRAKAKQALGDDFDLAEFHDVVLKNGAVPLDILERLIDNYIADKQS